MLIYIIHQDIIYKYRLPIIVSGKYILSDFDDGKNTRNLVNIEANNNKWYLISTANTKIFYNSNEVNTIELAPNTGYQLTYLGSEVITIWATSLYDSTFFTEEVSNDCKISIGSNNKNDIVFRSVNVSPKQIELEYKNDKIYYNNLNSKVNVYVNNIRKENGYLENFDTIFVCGYKIIVCGKKLIINNPNRSVAVNSTGKFHQPTYGLITGDYKTNVRTYGNFYNEKDYYFKSPVFNYDIEPFELEITEPPSKFDKDKSSVLMTVIPSAIMTISSLFMTMVSINEFRKGESSKENAIMELLMAISLIVGGLVWPFVEKFYNNFVATISNYRRAKSYNRYLKDKNNLLQKAISDQKMILKNHYQSLDECQTIINNKSPELFSRDINDKDFLSFKLGTGKILLNVEMNYKRPDYQFEKDPLYDDIDKMLERNKYIEDAPRIYSLKENNVLAVIINRNVLSNYMNGIILQLLTFHSYIDLKIIVLSSSENSELNFLKNTNHCWNGARNFRFFAANLQEGQKISTYLEKEFKMREENEKEEDVKGPYYLILSDNIEEYRNLNIINDIINTPKKLNFGILMFDTKMSNIPNNCRNFIRIDSNTGTYFTAGMKMENVLNFTPEFISNSNVNLGYCISKINNTPIKTNDEVEDDIPDNYGFLQMYNVGNINQLNIKDRWKESDVINSLSVPIGVDGHGQIINLDLHEKAHGPHGLIAGMTGSGKSEFIVTYILSLAINFNPDEVQFILIDYKGGGLAGAFENRKTGIKLPHLVGTITNLDKSEMNRTLVSINSELNRRQKLFNDAKETLNTGSIDIYKYQKLHREGKLEKSLSHLFIICDEFAELKQQQPDFMDELISAARIGRSLGIHLILATQKPTGVVDDQIWSNSKFKVCCRVQTVEDSNEMIKRPDAAYLKEAGRFFLQVGYDEYFVEGQSAYSGNPYKPSNTISTNLFNSISFISNTGDVYKNLDLNVSDKNTNQVSLGEESSNILNSIIEVAKEEDYKNHQLWLDNIPPVIYYQNVVNKYKPKTELNNIDSLIGEYDDPENQHQGYASLPITTGGNTVIVGATGMGKNTLISTFIFSTIINHNCDEVNFYIMDFGSEKLKKFVNAPQVGDVLTIEDEDKINNLFYMLEEEKDKRQKYYLNNGGDFLSDVKQKKITFSNIIVIIYDIEAFREAFEDLYDEKFAVFTRNCSKVGINFIITSSSVTSLNFVIENNFPQKIMLNMIDNDDYAMFFTNPPVPNNNPGRGIIKINDLVYQFQTALIAEESKEQSSLNYIFEQLNKFLKNKAKPVPVVPSVVEYSYIKDSINTLEDVPLGINMITAQMEKYNFNKTYLTMSSIGNKYAIPFINLLLSIFSKIPNNKIIVLNALENVELDVSEEVKVYNGGFSKIVPIIYNNVKTYMTKESSNNFIVFVLGYEQLYEHMNSLKEEDENIITIDDLLEVSKDSKYFKYLIYDGASKVDNLRTGDISNTIDLSYGLWIGRGLESQSVYDVFTIDENVKMTNDTVVVINNDNFKFIKFPKDGDNNG